MDTATLVEQATALKNRIQGYAHSTPTTTIGEAAKAQVAEFFRAYAGPRSSFTKEAEAVSGYNEYMVGTLSALLDSFVEFVQAGLATGLSPERKGQLDVVSDVLSQAQAMLDNSVFHPAGAAVIVGAALEEYLRTWVEAAGLSIGNAKPSIDAYAKSLRAADLISKQDVKDITAWAGTRNDAAHGHWDQVSDRNRIRLMLESVNLFMRQKQDQWATSAA